MSTRGAYGFHKEGMDKISYNHSDSFPHYLGKKIVTFLQENSIDELNEIYNQIQLVSEFDKASPKQIEECRKWANPNYHEVEELEDWRILLRKAQGNFQAYKDGLQYMIKYDGFLTHSLYCEWAYIVNLDTNQLEVYEGANKNREKEGRYKAVEPDEFGYVGVMPVIQFPLETIPENWEDMIYETYSGAIKPGNVFPLYPSPEYGPCGEVEILDVFEENGEKQVKYTYIKDNKGNKMQIKNEYTVSEDKFINL